MRRWFMSSLSSRLLAVFLVTAIAAVVLMSVLFSRGLGSQWQRAIVPHLIQYVAYVRQDLGSPPEESRARELATRLPIQIQVHYADSGKLLFTTRDKPLAIERIRFFNPQRWRASPEEREKNKQPSRRVRVGLRENIAISDDQRKPILRLGSDNYQIYIELDRPQGRESGLDELLLAVVGLALLLTLCYLAIRLLLKPIGGLQKTVQSISDGDLSARTAAEGSDDLAQLAQSVDSMAERIQQMLDAKRELLLAISHELRSPLTRARVATELLAPSRHKGKLINDIAEMEKLIAQLIESERLQTHVVLDLQSVDVGQLISDTVNSFDTHIEWSEPQEEIVLEGDKTRLQLLIRNLIDNALQHGKPTSNYDASVRVTLVSDDSQVTLVVADNGPGIDDIQLSSVTEAFYRPDSSRTRKTGGFGLGLHLCKRIVEAHQGSLVIESPRTEHVGVCVTVKLPRAIR